jgi:hypothetical protein
MSPYSTEGWSDLFLAGAGAAAALTGLVFVALSINLQRILALPGLSARAAGAIAVLTVALLVCLAGLVPQSEEALSIELVVAGVAGGAFGARAIHRRPIEGGPTRAQIRGQTVLMALPSIAVVIGAATLWADWGGGLYWVVAGLVLFLLNGIMNAWVLLVEIQR